MQKLPVYLYANLLTVQLDLDNSVIKRNETMYQREIKIQRGMKNKVQVQFRNSDQKLVHVAALSSTTSVVNSGSNSIKLASLSNVKLGMFLDNSSVQEGTFVSNIGTDSVTVSNLNPVFNPDQGIFLSPILNDIPAGTNLKFNHNFIFSMFDTEQQRMLIEKQLEVIDDGITTSTRGLALLSLNDSDIKNINSGYYTFGITLSDNDGQRLPVYSDTYYGINGTVVVSHNLYPTLKEGYVITDFQRFANEDEDANRYEFYTGNLRSFPDQTQTTTAALYLNNFSGTVKIQGTLDDSPGTFANYVDLETKTYSNFTGVDYVNAIGNWSNVRVLWYPNNSSLFGLLNYYSPSMPGNPTPGSDYWPNGKIDKIICRS
jgi:hypothetical protein